MTDVVDKGLYEWFHAHMLPLAQRHTVSIVAYYAGIPRHHATGTLVRFADHHFLVTAGHAIRQYVEGKEHHKDLGLLLDNGHDQDLVPLFGKFSATETARDVANPSAWSDDDPVDVAVWELDQNTVDGLTQKSFLTRRDISITADVTKGIFFLAGFPCIWTNTDVENRSFTLKAIRYIAHPYTSCGELPNFDARCHVALFLKQEPPMPEKFHGISGCPIWKLSDFPIPEDWTSEHARVVAVQTSIYPRRDAVRGTIWRWVLKCLMDVRPDLLEAFRLWLPGKE